METKTMTTGLIKKSEAEAQFGATKIHLQSLALRVAEVDIQDESSLSIATSLAIQLNGALKKIEEKRKELKKPYLDAGNIIEGIAKELTGDSNKAIQSVKAKMLFWNDRQKEIKVEELSSADEQFPLAQEEIVQIVNSAKVSNIRKTLDWKIVDHDKIPSDWLMLDVDKVKDYMKDHKESIKPGDVVNGIEFYIKESVVLR